MVCLEPLKNTMKVYVRGKSFKEVNDRLAEGRKLPAMDYSLLRAGIEFTLGEDVPDGTWVCIFKGIRNGFPYAHDFGTWSEAEGRLVNRRPHVWEKRI